MEPVSIVGFLQSPWFAIGILIISIWEAVWKGIGLWHSARNKQLVWFICILIFNTVGILPIIYLIWFKPVDGGKGKK